jgi:hypothetical protein
LGMRRKVSSVMANMLPVSTTSVLPMAINGDS